jgi:uncharacterized protein (DUF1330 family)
MPRGYVFTNVHPTGSPAPPEYSEGFRRVFAKYGARRLISTGQIEHREGKLDIGRLLVFEFADKASAVAAYEEYMRDVYPLNPRPNKRELFIVEGVD